MAWRRPSSDSPHPWLLFTDSFPPSARVREGPDTQLLGLACRCRPSSPSAKSQRDGCRPKPWSQTAEVGQKRASREIKFHSPRSRLMPRGSAGSISGLPVQPRLTIPVCSGIRSYEHHSECAFFKTRFRWPEQETTRNTCFHGASLGATMARDGAFPTAISGRGSSGCWGWTTKADTMNCASNVSFL
jgi:hypothetical protein